MHVFPMSSVNETFRKQVQSVLAHRNDQGKGNVCRKSSSGDILEWQSSRHQKTGGMLCSVKVNDNSISEHTLTINDRILIGSSSFQYVLHSDK